MARKRLKAKIGAIFGLGLESMKKETEWILCVRTKNRERCPWLLRPRRLRVTESRELGKLALYLRYKGCLQPHTL